ncbi:MAG: CapA family protein [Candidatus Ventricola sp.]
MAMLLLTALVVLGCVCFLSMIVGDDLSARTGDFLRTLADDGLFDASPAAPAPTPTAEPRIVWIEETPVPTAQPTQTPEPLPVTITIAAAGAVYAPKTVRESALTGSLYDFAPMFAGLGDTLSAADLAIATLETTTAGQDKGFGNYNTAPEILDALRGCGVDLLSLATERALDKGYEGLELTIRSLTARGLACAGASADAEGGGATMMRIGGVQVAVLAYSYGLSDEGIAKTDGDKRAAVALMDTQRMIDDIRQARADGANVVIVLPHWGTKNISETPVNVKRLAVQLAEAGADVILGTHPNVPQGTERLTVTRADGLTHETVVCYSLGSLLTDSRMAENTAGMVAHVSVTYDPVTRRTTLGEMYCTPVYIARQRENDETVYRIVDAESAAALSTLTESEQEAAREAVEIIRRATQADEQEGQG